MGKALADGRLTRHLGVVHATLPPHQHHVVCDANLPGVGSVEFLTMLGVERPGVLRVLISGAHEEVRDPAVCELAFGKPWGRGEIESTIEEALALRPLPAS